MSAPNSIMARPERQQNVLDLLKGLRGIEPLKQLFWSELNYQRVNEPLSRRGWTDSASQALADDPILFAGGGENNDFHVIYGRLASHRLLFGNERPVVSRLVKEHPYALFVFSNKAQDRWHFLNVKYDEEADRRRLFRRITVGPGERLRTAAQRISLLDLGTIGAELFALPPMTIQNRCDQAFDVEAIAQEFFQKFAELYHRVADDIAEVRGLQAEAGKLAQLLLDRMIFLYFIQKKGWLHQASDYLYDRFLECWRRDPNGTGYYSELLYPLFLCLSEAGKSFEKVGGIPFLNGGLFEESAQQTQAQRLLQTRLQIKNRTFKAIFEELLERFNFTVAEDTPLDIEVAIDPEMLGKIFESLILQLEKDPGKDLRRLTGSYYTPRVIVHFMCQEALTGYLSSQLVESAGGTLQDARKRIRSLLTLPPADQFDDADLHVLDQLFTEPDAKALRTAILDCRVCDPAVGSGAFPVGMLHEMTAAAARLDVRLHGRDHILRRNYDYDLKKQIIENCLYGVDIQEQAVRLCELRLWLSLVVDYDIDQRKDFSEAIREVPSLPNLSYRIMRGDSLLERLFGQTVQLDQMAKDAKTKQLIESIQADKQAYLREGSTAEKRHLELKILAKQADLAKRLVEAKRQQLASWRYQTNIFGEAGMSVPERQAKLEKEQKLRDMSDLKAQVEGATQRIQTLLHQKDGIHRRDLEALRRQHFKTGENPTFLWRVDFAEVFLKDRGFNIVIANPPYLSFGLRGNKIAAKEWADTVRITYPGSAEYKISVYALFLDLALRLLEAGGVACYITPDSFLLGRYFSKIRRTMLNQSAIRTILMFQSDFWKSGVVGRPTVISYQKGGDKEDITAMLTETQNTLNSGQYRKYCYSQKYFETVPYNRFRLFFSPIAKKYVEKFESNSVPLGSIARITTGVRAKSGQAGVVSSTKIGPTWKKGITSGSQVLPYKVTWKGDYLNIDGKLLFAGGWDASLVERPKIMIRQTGDTIIAGLDYTNLYHLNNVHTLAPIEQGVSLPYVCALLNSRAMNRYYHLVSLENGRAMAQTDIETLDLLPYCKASKEDTKEIEALVQNIGKNGAQQKIDAIIARLFGLNGELSAYLAQDEFYP